jgi:AcrR family transcriptional regulator
VIASDSGTRRQRVPALSPEDRRAALIAATIPLLREHGTDVSTRQIADAAGVAEGTIFGVFKDKASLLRAAVVAALDPQPLLRGLKAIDPNLPLRPRLVAAAHLVREHVAGHGALFFVVRGPLFLNDRSHLVELKATRFLILNELTLLIEHDARLLRRSPAIAARLLLSLVGSPRGAFGPLDEVLDDEDAVSLVLDGLLVHPHPADSSTMEAPC